VLYGIGYWDKLAIAQAWHAIIGNDYADFSHVLSVPRAITGLGDIQRRADKKLALARVEQRQMVDVRPPFTRIEAIKNKRKLISYVSKYAAKADDDHHHPAPPPAARKHYRVHTTPRRYINRSRSAPARGFNYAPYSHAGRHWGKFAAHNLPFAHVIKISVMEVGGAAKAMFDLRRYAKKAWSGLQTTQKVGWSLFADAETWHALLMYTLNQQDDVRLSPSVYYHSPNAIG
jgi:hypothetical protein